MIALALHLAQTAEHPAPFHLTSHESVMVLQAMERYARGDTNQRLAASEDMHRIITRFGARVFEEATCKR